MATDRNQSLERIAREIVPGGKLLRAWELKGGISAAMTALEIESPAGQKSRMIVRRHGQADLQRNPDVAAGEFRLLQILQSEGVAAPAPLHLDPSGEILPTPYLVLGYLEGEMGFAPSDLDDAVLQLATHLAGIHRIDGTDPHLSFLPQAAEEWERFLSNRPARLDSSLDQGRILEALTSVWPLPQRNPSVLLHGDYWPGNALWRDEQLVAVIDWENAKLGDPLADLANARAEIVWIFGAQAMQSFTDHYRSLTGINDTHLPYWDLCAALRLAGWAGSDLAGVAAFFAPYGRADITEQSIRESHRFFVRQAFDKLAVS